MKLSEDQIELVKKMKGLRRTKKIRRMLMATSIIPIALVFWFQLSAQISVVNIISSLCILLAVWINAFLYPAPTRSRIEDLLLEYINNDPESLSQLSGHSIELARVDAV